MLTLNDGRSELWQWDTGRTLAVDADCSQVHFSNKVFGRSIDVDVIDGAAIIPDVMLQTDKELNVWAFVGTAENGYTKISKTFKVNRRNKPADYVFTPTDQMTLQTIQSQIGDLAGLTTEAKDTLVAAINEAARTGGGAGSIELRVAGGYVQYSRDGGMTWTNLIAMADLKGDHGADGKSAYQYAQDGGFAGTEAEFSAKMAAEIPIVDITLTQSGQAADAKETGDRLNAISEEIANLSDSTANASGIELTLEDCINKAPKSFLVTGNLISSATDVVSDTFSLSRNGSPVATAPMLFALSKSDGTVFADVLDAVSKTITYRVRKLTFTGAEAFTYSQYYCNIFTIENAADYHNSASNYDTTCGAICSHFKLINYGNITPTGAYKNGWFGLSKNGDKINFGYCPDGETQATPEQLQAYFAEQYAAGTPVTIYYILAAEKTETVSIPDIVLEKGTNIISNDANFQMNIEYYVTGSSATDTSDCVKNTATVDPENEYWSNFKNFMGRNPSVSPIPEQMMAPLESAGMITANADRWKTGQQGMSTKGELSDSTFVQGGHVFEGWDTEKMWRLTMLIGKFAVGNVHIFAFKPNESGVEEFGIVTIGSDHKWEGLDVAKKYAHMWGPIIANSGFTGPNNYGSQKYYGGISGTDKTTPAGANMEITASENSVAPNRVQFNGCKNGMKIPVLESDPTVLEDGVFWFNSTEGAFKGVVGGEIKVFTLS